MGPNLLNRRSSLVAQSSAWRVFVQKFVSVGSHPIQLASDPLELCRLAKKWKLLTKPEDQTCWIYLPSSLRKLNSCCLCAVLLPRFKPTSFNLARCATWFRYTRCSRMTQWFFPRHLWTFRWPHFPFCLHWDASFLFSPISVQPAHFLTRSDCSWVKVW